MMFPLGAFGLGTIIAGALSVVFYRWRNPGAKLRPSVGARLGALSGLLGFLILLFFTALNAFISGGSELRTALAQAVEQSASRAADPQSQRMLEFFRTTQGMATLLIAGIVFGFIVFLIFGAMGGAIGAAISRRKTRE
jgi:hypothetical protein